MTFISLAQNLYVQFLRGYLRGRALHALKDFVRKNHFATFFDRDYGIFRDIVWGGLL